MIILPNEHYTEEFKAHIIDNEFNDKMSRKAMKEKYGISEAKIIGIIDEFIEKNEKRIYYKLPIKLGVAKLRLKTT